MDDRGILWSHEEVAARVERIVDRIRSNWPCGCKLGGISVENAETASGNWYECLKGQDHKLLLFVTSPRILDFLRPLIKSLKEEFILLTTTSIPDGLDVPSNGTVVRFRMPKAKLFRKRRLKL